MFFYYLLIINLKIKIAKASLNVMNNQIQFRIICKYSTNKESQKIDLRFFFCKYGRPIL